MRSLSRILKLSPILVLIALAIPGSAFGQATRTWVSGVGDDANPCSRTAPCKTFAGAISKTANGGEINCLDPGGFGGVTITKSLTIKCHYTEGGALVAGTNGIVINATASDKVTLRGIDLNGAGGAGGAAPTSLNGIKVISAKAVSIVDSEIYQFKVGVNINPTSAQTRVVLARNHIHNNDIGVINTPGNNLIQFTVANLRWNEIQDNVCGVVTGSGGANGSTPTTTSCGTLLPGAIDKVAATHIHHNGINFNGTGVFSRGTNSTAEIAWDEITNNSTLGLDTVDSGKILTTSPVTNVISSNGGSDPPTGTTVLTKRQVKRMRK